jgi:hypothetical protein
MSASTLAYRVSFLLKPEDRLSSVTHAFLVVVAPTHPMVEIVPPYHLVPMGVLESIMVS